MAYISKHNSNNEKQIILFWQKKQIFEWRRIVLPCSKKIIWIIKSKNFKT